MHKLDLFVVLESKFGGMLLLLLMTCECQQEFYTKSVRCRANVVVTEPCVLSDFTKKTFLVSLTSRSFK